MSPFTSFEIPELLLNHTPVSSYKRSMTEESFRKKEKKTVFQDPTLAIWMTIMRNKYNYQQPRHSD